MAALKISQNGELEEPHAHRDLFEMYKNEVRVFWKYNNALQLENAEIKLRFSSKQTHSREEEEVALNQEIHTYKYYHENQHGAETILY